MFRRGDRVVDMQLPHFPGRRGTVLGPYKGGSTLIEVKFDGKPGVFAVSVKTLEHVSAVDRLAELARSS